MLGVCPERLRHDGAGENLGANGLNSVVQLCYERGIYPERTVPYNPQQLSRAERANRSNLEMVRCMMSTAGADVRLWGYCFMHAAYLDQFLSSGSKCPYERWHGHAPPDDLVNNLRTWHSIVYFTHNEDRQTVHTLIPSWQGGTTTMDRRIGTRFSSSSRISRRHATHTTLSYQSMVVGC